MNMLPMFASALETKRKRRQLPTSGLLSVVLLVVGYSSAVVEAFSATCYPMISCIGRPLDRNVRYGRKSQRWSQNSDENISSTSTSVREDEKDGSQRPSSMERLEMSQSDAESVNRRNLVINAVALGLLGASGVASYSLFQTSVYTPPGFRRLGRTQFIAALGDPKASQGTEAKSWGVWMEDPGPRGVWLRDYNKELVQHDNLAPAGWTYDRNDWWLEEHGIIMEAPKFPLQEGRYLVTGGRMVTTGLTIDGNGGWKLDEGTLYDVTHLPCRSARYQPQDNAVTGAETFVGSPLAANPRDFPVTPGAVMPEVKGCTKQDYAVLFVVGKAVQS